MISFWHFEPSECRSQINRVTLSWSHSLPWYWLHLMWTQSLPQSVAARSIRWHYHGPVVSNELTTFQEALAVGLDTKMCKSLERRKRNLYNWRPTLIWIRSLPLVIITFSNFPHPILPSLLVEFCALITPLCIVIVWCPFWNVFWLWERKQTFLLSPHLIQAPELLLLLSFNYHFWLSLAELDLSIIIITTIMPIYLNRP